MAVQFNEDAKAWQQRSCCFMVYRDVLMARLLELCEPLAALSSDDEVGDPDDEVTLQRRYHLRQGGELD